MSGSPEITGLVLSGGGARAAYQIGALRAITHILPRERCAPFPVICGTSAGAINAAMLANHADNIRLGIARLIRLWSRLEVGRVYRSDARGVARTALRWLSSALVGGSGKTISLFDNRPLRMMLHREIDFSRIDRLIAQGHLLSLSINATSYASGKAMTFYQGAHSLNPWRRTRREGVPAKLSVDHLMASSAIPFIFPAARIGTEYYADGSMRQLAPISPALHLGAKRILVVAVGQLATRSPATDAPTRYPSLAQIAGHALSSIFLDNLSTDIERLQHINKLVSLVPRDDLATRGMNLEHVNVLVINPTEDIARIAVRYAHRLPGPVKLFLRRLGKSDGGGANLLSYLLFDGEFCRALMDLGYRDALARRDEIEAFLGSDASRFTPLFPPEFR
ncbi:MAG: patatin-like phospholipase family protein [Betaproteobacteria bacterium]|nr:patatin-like phospholipase family protein [Betaproteobacteria bacterium]